MEVIGNVAFGIETNALHDPNDEFLRRSRWIFSLQEKPPRGLKIIGTLGGQWNMDDLMEMHSNLFKDVGKVLLKACIFHLSGTVFQDYVYFLCRRRPPHFTGHVYGFNCIFTI